MAPLGLRPRHGPHPQSAHLLWQHLRQIGKATAEFDYIPRRFLNDLANSDPSELCWRYVFNREQQDGFTRLWTEKRLDLSVKNLVWQHRGMFASAPAIVLEAERKLRAAGFDPVAQRMVQ